MSVSQLGIFEAIYSLSVLTCKLRFDKEQKGQNANSIVSNEALCLHGCLITLQLPKLCSKEEKYCSVHKTKGKTVPLATKIAPPNHSISQQSVIAKPHLAVQSG